MPELTANEMGRRPRVVRIIARLNTGGVAASLLVQEIHGLPGYDSTILSGRPEENEDEMHSLLPRLPFPVEYVSGLQRSIAPASDWRVVMRILARLREIGPDVIETHTAKAGLLGRLAAALYNRHRRSAGRRPARVIHYFHGHVFAGDYFARTKTLFFLRLERSLARRATDLIVVPCGQQADELATVYEVGHREQYRVVPYGIEVSDLADQAEHGRREFRRELGIGSDDVAVGIVGRLERVKNHALFIEGAALALKKLDADPGAGRVLFLIIGDGSLRPELEAQAREAGIGGHVRFLGNRHDRERFLPGLDLAVLTSRNEGYPVALLEALAVRKPVVATAVGGVTELIRHEETGVLVRSEAPAELADAIVALVRDPERRRRLGEAGHRFVLDNHDVRHMVAATCGLYDEILGHAQISFAREDVT